MGLIRASAKGAIGASAAGIWLLIVSSIAPASLRSATSPPAKAPLTFLSVFATLFGAGVSKSFLLLTLPILLGPPLGVNSSSIPYTSLLLVVVLGVAETA